MSAAEHNRILAIGFAAFAVIFFFMFMLLLVVSAGVFVAQGITFANETGDNRQAGMGILGGVFAVVFYVVLGLIFVLPTAVASWKMLKRGKKARLWGHRGDSRRPGIPARNDVSDLRILVLLRRGR
jgi:membrane-anchored glycerophosphoryl diester phosphodiesterase (GDPDase)